MGKGRCATGFVAVAGPSADVRDIRRRRTKSAAMTAFASWSAMPSRIANEISGRPIESASVGAPASACSASIRRRYQPKVSTQLARSAMLARANAAMRFVRDVLHWGCHSSRSTSRFCSRRLCGTRTGFARPTSRWSGATACRSFCDAREINDPVAHPRGGVRAWASSFSA